MGVDPRNASQQVRGVVLLPHGLGRPVRVLVFAQGEAERVAKEAGADFVGSDDLVKQIEGGWLEFDTAMATPDMMGKVGKLGKILGRRGLMPNPKSGTVVPAEDLARVIEDSRNGVLAAKAAGMHVVATTNVYTEKEDLHEADLVMTCLGDLDGEKGELKQGGESLDYAGVLHLDQLMAYFSG